MATRQNRFSAREKAAEPIPSLLDAGTASDGVGEEKVGAGAAAAPRRLLVAETAEIKSIHESILITESLSRKIEAFRSQGGFRSKNAAITAILEDYLSG